jgi:hypothetical protein
MDLSTFDFLGGSGGGEYFKSKGYESNPQTEYKLRKNI